MPRVDRERKAWLQFELRRRGIEQSDIARACGVSAGTVSRVIAGRSGRKRRDGLATANLVADEIAKRTGVPRQTLFPALVRAS